MNVHFPYGNPLNSNREEYIFKLRLQVPQFMLFYTQYRVIIPSSAPSSLLITTGSILPSTVQPSTKQLDRSCSCALIVHMLYTVQLKLSPRVCAINCDGYWFTV